MKKTNHTDRSIPTPILKTDIVTMGYIKVSHMKDGVRLSINTIINITIIVSPKFRADETLFDIMNIPLGTFIFEMIPPFTESENIPAVTASVK